MKLSYFPDTDTLYIDLANRPGVDSDEVSPDVVLDLDTDGNVVGIEIEHAKESGALEELVYREIGKQSA
jgi:uncharacterized protein YuzE